MRSRRCRAAAAAVVVGRARAAVALQHACRGATLPFSFAGREMTGGAVANGDLIAAVAVPSVVGLLLASFGQLRVSVVTRVNHDNSRVSTRCPPPCGHSGVLEAVWCLLPADAGDRHVGRRYGSSPQAAGLPAERLELAEVAVGSTLGDRRAGAPERDATRPSAGGFGRGVDRRRGRRLTYLVTAAPPAAAGCATPVATAENLLGVPRVQFGCDSSWLRHAAIAAEILLRTWGLMMARICEITSASMPTGIPFPQSLYAAVSSIIPIKGPFQSSSLSNGLLDYKSVATDVVSGRREKRRAPAVS